MITTRTPTDRPFAGQTAWLITDGKAGMNVQAKGIADALGAQSVFKEVAPKGLQKFAAPWGPVARDEKFGQPGTLFAPPWPALAIATGRQSIPYVRALKKAAGSATFTVVLQDPKSGKGTADFIWVPAHDKLRGPNVLATLTSPHSFSAERLASLRATVPPDIAKLPSPRVAVVLGGKNGVYKFTDACDDRLRGALQSLAALGASFMITPSRRTHPRLLRQVDAATKDAPRILWQGDGDNPYPQFLAHADMLVVTADSVNMTGEACATGKPVYVFLPSGGSPKFQRFHEALTSAGATRALPDRVPTLDGWTYAPIDDARLIAAEINGRYLRRLAMLPEPV
jgi:uncharacterized protein